MSPVWSGIWCVIDGESVYDARCLTASLRQSYGVRFEPNGDFEINIITGTSGDHYQERGAEGYLAVACQTVDVTQCGQASYGLPISFDGTYLRIGSIWVLEALPEQYDREPRSLCR